MENRECSIPDHNNVTSYRSVPELLVKTMCFYVKRNYLSREELSSHYEELEEENEDEPDILQKLATIATDYEWEVDEEIKLSWSQFTAFEHVLTQWVDIIVALQKVSQQHALENKKLSYSYEYEEDRNKNMCTKYNRVINIPDHFNDPITEIDMQNNTTKLHKIYDVDEITNSESTKNDLFSVETSNAGWLFANLNKLVNTHLSFAHQCILPTPWSQVNATDTKTTSLFNSIARLCHLYNVLHIVKLEESKILNVECKQVENEMCIEELIASLRHFAKQGLSQEEKTLNVSDNNEIIILNLSQFISIWVNAICEKIKVKEEIAQEEQNTSAKLYHNDVGNDTECIIELHAKLVFLELLRLSPTTDSSVQENRANIKNYVSFLYLERALKYYAMNVLQSRKINSNMKCDENIKEHTSIPANQDTESCTSCDYNNKNKNKKREKLSVGILYGLALHYPMHIASSLNNNHQEYDNHNDDVREHNRNVKAERTTSKHKRKRKRIDDSDDDESDSDSSDVIEEIVIDEAKNTSDEDNNEDIHKNNFETNSENLLLVNKAEIQPNKSFEIDLHHSRWRRAQRWRSDVIKQRAISHKQQNMNIVNKSKINNKVYSISTPISTKQINQMNTVFCGQTNSCNKCSVNVNITNYDVEVASGILTCYDNIHDKTKIENVHEYYVHNATVHWYTQGSVATDNYGSNSMQVEKLLLQQQPTRTKSKEKHYRFSKTS